MNMTIFHFLWSAKSITSKVSNVKIHQYIKLFFNCQSEQNVLRPPICSGHISRVKYCYMWLFVLIKNKKTQSHVGMACLVHWPHVTLNVLNCPRPLSWTPGTRCSSPKPVSSFPWRKVDLIQWADTNRKETRTDIGLKGITACLHCSYRC